MAEVIRPLFQPQRPKGRARFWTPARLELVATWKRQGLSHAAIAERIGSSESAVGREVKRLKLKVAKVKKEPKPERILRQAARKDSSIVTEAQLELGRRFEDRNGQWFISLGRAGRFIPCDLNMLMREANKVRARRDPPLPPLGKNPEWVA